MHSNSTVNLVNKPTWFPRGAQLGSPSLLDHFYTNQLSKIKNFGLLIDDITDHFPLVATISMQAKKYPHQLPPYIRDFRNFDIESFNRSLGQFHDNESENLDARFYNAHLHILSCIDSHLPLQNEL